MLVRQLEEEVVKTRQHAKETNPEIKAHIEGLQLENDHLTREVAILKETIKVSPFAITYLLHRIVVLLHTNPPLKDVHILGLFITHILGVSFKSMSFLESLQGTRFVT